VGSAYKKRNSWYIQYTDETGKRRLKATKARTKTEANRIVQELELDCQRIRLGLTPAKWVCPT
jgi:hypothetical protein